MSSAAGSSAAAKLRGGSSVALAMLVLNVTTYGFTIAAALGVVLLLLTPVINALLQLDDLPMAALLGVSAVPLTIVGGLNGILQGERRWGALSAVQVCIGAPRLIVGVALMVWRPDP